MMDEFGILSPPLPTPRVGFGGAGVAGLEFALATNPKCSKLQPQMHI